MKRHFCALLVVCILLGLCACGKKQNAAVPHTYEDLTISLPADFIDLSDEAFAAGLTFLQGLDPIAVNGMREEKSVFAAYGLDLNLERYAKLVVLSNNLTNQPEKKDNVLTFSYEAVTDGVSYTYVVTLWETKEAFWTVQAYCPTSEYTAVKDDIWEILSSVTV